MTVLRDICVAAPVARAVSDLGLLARGPVGPDHARRTSSYASPDGSGDCCVDRVPAWNCEGAAQTPWPSYSGQLILGIVLSWFGVAGSAGWVLIWASGGQPQWMLDSTSMAGSSGSRSWAARCT